MNGQTEHVDVKLPSGETITAIVPSGTSDAGVRQLLQQQHPEYFAGKAGAKTQATPAKVPSAFTSSDLNYSTKVPEAQRSPLGRMFSPENFQRAQDISPDAPIGERAGAAAARAIGSVYNLFRGPTTEDEAKIMASQGTPGYLSLLANRLMSGSVDTAQKTAQSLQQAKQTRSFGDAAKTLGYGAATALPIVGPGIASAAERAGRGDVVGGVSDLVMPAVLGKGLSGNVESPIKSSAVSSYQDFNAFNRAVMRGMTKQDILQQAHAKLNLQVEPAQATIRDVPLQNLRSHVGQFVNGIDAADVRNWVNGQPQISTSFLHPALDDLTNKYRSVVGDSRFEAAQNIVNSLDPNIAWRDLHDAKMQMRSLWAKAPEGSPIKSALNSLSETMEDKLGARATEVNQMPQYNKYRQLTKTYHTYESNDSAVGKLLDANMGKGFFDTLRNPALQNIYDAQGKNIGFVGASQDLAKYGLPENFFSKLAADNADLHDFTSSAGGTGFRGKIRAIMEEPLPAMLGMFGGRMLAKGIGAPMLGGLIGAMKMADLAETARARSVLARQGFAPTGGMVAEDNVRPGPQGPTAADVRSGAAGPQPAAPVGPAPAVSMPDLVSALTNQGFKPAWAKQAAAYAIGKSPQDFTEALRLALSQKKGP